MVLAAYFHVLMPLVLHVAYLHLQPIKLFVFCFCTHANLPFIFDSLFRKKSIFVVIAWVSDSLLSFNESLALVRFLSTFMNVSMVQYSLSPCLSVESYLTNKDASIDF